MSKEIEELEKLRDKFRDYSVAESDKATEASKMKLVYEGAAAGVSASIERLKEIDSQEQESDGKSEEDG